MSATALRDEIKLQLDMQLGAAPPPFEADRLKIAQAFADAIDPHFLHAGESADPATSTTLGMVKTDTDPVGDPVVYLKESVDDLLAGKANVVHSHAFSEITGKPSTLAGYGITDAAPANHNHDGLYLKLSGGAISGLLTVSRVGDGVEILRFDTERRWSFFQRGTGPSAALELRPEFAGKSFIIANDAGTPIAEFHGSSTQVDRVDLIPNGGIARVAGNTIWHAGNLDPNSFATSGHNHDSVYLKLSGGDLTGNLHLKMGAASQRVINIYSDDTANTYWQFVVRSPTSSTETQRNDLLLYRYDGTNYNRVMWIRHSDLVVRFEATPVVGSNAIWHAGNLNPNSFATAGHTHALSGLSDTSITSPATNHVLLWNGSAWVNSTPSGGGSPVGTSRAINTGTGLTGGGNLSANRTISLDTTYTDGRYLKLTGGTLTGPVTISGNGILPQWTPTDGNVEGSAYPNGITVAYVANDQTYPIGYGTLLSFKHSNSRFAQFFVRNDSTPDLWLRTWYNDHWNPWVKLWHDQNDGSNSGLDADLLDGQHASAFALANHGHTFIDPLTTQEPETGRSVHATGVYSFRTMSSTTNKPGGMNYTAVLGFGRGTSGSAQIAIGWGSPEEGRVYVRSLRDTTDNWWPWRKVYTEKDPPTFAEIASKPTTLSGYGITDAYTKSEADSRYLRLTGGSVSGTLYLTSTQVANLINDGALTVGPKTGKNLAISGTSIVARNNGAPAPLYLNAGSGDVYASGYKVLTERNRSEFAAADHNHDSTYLKLTGGSLVASGDPAIPLSLMRNASSNGDVVLHMSAVNIMSRGSQIRATRLGTGNAHDLSFWTSANGSEPTERIRIGGNGGVQIFDYLTVTDSYIQAAGVRMGFIKHTSVASTSWTTIANIPRGAGLILVRVHLGSNANSYRSYILHCSHMHWVFAAQSGQVSVLSSHYGQGSVPGANFRMANASGSDWVASLQIQLDTAVQSDVYVYNLGYYSLDF